MSDDSQLEQDEYKINTVIAARRAFERSEERERERERGNSNDREGGRRRLTQRSYESPASKYCPCCRDKVSTAILLCNSGLMTVTSQIAVICTIYIATTGLNIVPNGLVAIFLLTCFAISIFGLCGIIGPIRKTFGKPPPTGAKRTSSNFCILSYMVANLVVLIIFFISLCFCLSFLSRSAILKEIRAVEKADAGVLVDWMESYATDEANIDEWRNFQYVAECCGFQNDTAFDPLTMPEICNQTNSEGERPTSCFTELVISMWNNLNLLSGIMGFLFVLQLMAACAAFQLLCCSQTRNQFSDAAEMAVKKLGIAMDTAQNDVQEDEVLLDSDYSSNSDEDHDREIADSKDGEDYDRFDGNGLYADANDSGNSGREGSDFNITQRSSGPDSSDEDNDAARRASDSRSATDSKTSPRVATYAQEIIEVDAEDNSSADGLSASEHSV